MPKYITPTLRIDTHDKQCSLVCIYLGKTDYGASKCWLFDVVLSPCAIKGEFYSQRCEKCLGAEEI